MTSSEEYLDSLLKDLSNSDPDGESGMNRVAGSKAAPEEEIDFFANDSEEDEIPVADNPEETIITEENKGSDLLADMLDNEDILNLAKNEETSMPIEQPEEIEETPISIEEPEEIEETPAAPSEPMEIDLDQVPDLTDELGIKDFDKINEDATADPSSLGENDSELDEINALLNNAGDQNQDNDDMLALLESVSESKDEQDSSQSNDDFDIFAMDVMDEEKASAPSPEDAGDTSDELDELLGDTSEQAQGKNGKAKKDKKTRVKKEKTAKTKKSKKKEAEAEQQVDALFDDVTADQYSLDALVPKKKKGFFGKIADALLEEEPEDETGKESIDNIPERAAGEENLAILEELDAEEDPKAKKKKKKGKKSKNSKAQQDDQEENSKSGKKAKKQKKAKAPEEEPIDDGKKLVPKKVMPIFIVAFAFLAVVLIATIMIPNMISNSVAAKQFYNGDYEEAYQSLSGRDLSKSDKILYEKASVLMRIQCKLDDYNLYLYLDDDMKAVDSLFEGARRYQDLEDEIVALKIEQQADEIYQKILTIFKDTYQLSKSDVDTVISYEDKVTYTKILVSVLEGKGIDIFTVIIPDTPVESNNDMQNLGRLDDVLPSEQDALDSVEDYLNDIPDEMQEDITGDIPDEMQEDIPNDMPDEMQENIPDDMTGDMPDDMQNGGNEL